ncbi:MAG TPA: metallophosphoesterase [Thermoanaerobaculia bacterium]|nr:metallophosphoesterase [Thermoanaerobaculia bacterium]
MLILHLSDLHFGAHSPLQGEDLTKLGKAFFKDLEAARGGFAKGSRIDLVAVTGDVSESGKPPELQEGELFLAALAGELGLDRRRFVFVPGNHDVSWSACKKVAADQEEEGFDEAELRKRLDAVKLDRYEEFLLSFYGVKDLAEVALPLGRGAFLYDFPDLHLSVAALNSCEKESHRPADHVGFLSREQAEALMTEWLTPQRSGWLKIVTVHHNPGVTVPGNLAKWRKEMEEKGLDPELVARYESDIVGFEGQERLRAIVEDSHVQLILHGHHHAKDEQSWDWQSRIKGRAAVLSAGSLSLTPDNLPEDEPLSVRLIALDTREKEIRARSLVFDPRARAKGELRHGAFIPDPMEPGGYWQELSLYLPPGSDGRVLDLEKPVPAAAFATFFDGREHRPAETRATGKTSEPGTTPLAPTPGEKPPEKPREVFISYAWGDDETPEGRIRAQAVEGLCAALVADGFLPVRDRDQILPGEQISAFIRRLTHADHIVAVISNKYLRSSYCMYEIYKLWQSCQGEADDLVQRLVPIMLPEVKTGSFEERAPYLEYWSERAVKLGVLIRNPNLQPSSESWKEFKLVQDFANHVDDILVFLQDVLMPRKLEVYLDDDFQVVREALRRRMAAGLT